MSVDWEQALRDGAERRRFAAAQERLAIGLLNAQVRGARAAGMSAARIAEVIGTTRQRVYEILREG